MVCHLMDVQEVTDDFIRIQLSVVLDRLTRQHKNIPNIKYAQAELTVDRIESVADDCQDRGARRQFW
jgi:hypothetical protein